MNFWLVLGIALGLAMDAFAVSLGLACGPGGLRRAQSRRLALHFGLFQFAMPVIGWFAGENLLRYIKGIDHWVAFGLLGFIGGKMIYESFKKNEEEEACKTDPTRGSSLLLLSVATSIDALAVGLSLGVLKVTIFYPAAIIGFVCFGMTLLGAAIGPAAGKLIGKRAEFAGGLVLILIGVKILTEHLA